MSTHFPKRVKMCITNKGVDASKGAESITAKTAGTACPIT